MIIKIVLNTSPETNNTLFSRKKSIIDLGVIRFMMNDNMDALYFH